MYDAQAFKRRRNGVEIDGVNDYMDDFEKKLSMLCEFLKQQDVRIKSNADSDGRQVSQEKEDEIIDIIKKRFSDFVITKKDDPDLFRKYSKHINRDKGDFYIRTLDNFTPFPVNLKLITSAVSNLTGTTSAVSIALYNMSFEDKLEVAEKIQNNYSFTKEIQHYGFIAMHKETGEVKCFTLFSINEEALVINRTNGFQFKFNKLRPVKRTQQEGQIFIKNKFVELCYKEAEPADLLRGMCVKGHSQSDLFVRN